MNTKMYSNFQISISVPLMNMVIVTMTAFTPVLLITKVRAICGAIKHQLQSITTAERE